jgi:hypothetical protein
MYIDSPTRRRSADTSRRRGGCHKPARQAAVATASREPAATAAARRSRLDDAIVAQWLLDQLPAEHRHLRAA